VAGVESLVLMDEFVVWDSARLAHWDQDDAVEPIHVRNVVVLKISALDFVGSRRYTVWLLSFTMPLVDSV